MENRNVLLGKILRGEVPTKSVEAWLDAFSQGVFLNPCEGGAEGHVFHDPELGKHDPLGFVIAFLNFLREDTAVLLEYEGLAPGVDFNPDETPTEEAGQASPLPPTDNTHKKQRQPAAPPLDHGQRQPPPALDSGAGRGAGGGAGAGAGSGMGPSALRFDISSAEDFPALGGGGAPPKR
ncbi:unnamed protein product, partial [Discosporangium mesarthrocarpum]